MKKVAFVS